MKKFTFTSIASGFSAVLWLMDSLVHKHIYAQDTFEFIPSDGNELWMRITIVVLVVALGMHADRREQLAREHEQDKRKVFNATVAATQHILNNFLNQMLLFKMKIDMSDCFDKETYRQYEQVLDEVTQLVEKLSSVEVLTEENITSSVYPATGAGDLRT